MVKTFVIDPEEGQAKTPFLRGILTSSLHHAGLPFEEASALASKVRDELEDRPEVTTKELHEIVLSLISDYGPRDGATLRALGHYAGHDPGA